MAMLSHVVNIHTYMYQLLLSYFQALLHVFYVARMLLAHHLHKFV